jgi:hypothetical protein
MSHTPLIPEAARSPYPLHPEPIAAHDSSAAEAEGSATNQGAAAAESARPETEDESLAGRARRTFDRATESRMAVGAAFGIGSAALVAAFLFARRGRAKSRA